MTSWRRARPRATLHFPIQLPRVAGGIESGACHGYAESREVQVLCEDRRLVVGPCPRSLQNSTLLCRFSVEGVAAVEGGSHSPT